MKTTLKNSRPSSYINTIVAVKNDGQKIIYHRSDDDTSDYLDFIKYGLKFNPTINSPVIANLFSKNIIEELEKKESNEDFNALNYLSDNIFPTITEEESDSNNVNLFFSSVSFGDKEYLILQLNNSDNIISLYGLDYIITTTDSDISNYIFEIDLSDDIIGSKLITIILSPGSELGTINLASEIFNSESNQFRNSSKYVLESDYFTIDKNKEQDYKITNGSLIFDKLSGNILCNDVIKKSSNLRILNDRLSKIKNVWSPNIKYKSGDIIVYNNTNWICLYDNINSEPITSTYWEINNNDIKSNIELINFNTNVTNGKIVKLGTNVSNFKFKKGSKIDFEVIPDYGYSIKEDSITISPNTISPVLMNSDNNRQVYTIDNLSESILVSAEFKQDNTSFIPSFRYNNNIYSMSELYDLFNDAFKINLSISDINNESSCKFESYNLYTLKLYNIDSFSISSQKNVIISIEVNNFDTPYKLSGGGRVPVIYMFNGQTGNPVENLDTVDIIKLTHKIHILSYDNGQVEFDQKFINDYTSVSLDFYANSNYTLDDIEISGVSLFSVDYYNEAVINKNDFYTSLFNSTELDTYTINGKNGYCLNIENIISDLDITIKFKKNEN